MATVATSDLRVDLGGKRVLDGIDLTVDAEEEVFEVITGETEEERLAREAQE